ncbi:MAG: hypothetical protein IK152_04530 [Lachnospiraceae bacterium]|nr:hypothetical protein [Lachnospiraceae bacterium]
MKKRIIALFSVAVLALASFGVVYAEDEDDEEESLLEKYEDQILTYDDGVLYNGSGDEYSLGSVLDDEDLDVEAALAHLAAQHKDAKNHLVSIFKLNSDADKDDPATVKIALSDVKSSKGYNAYRFNTDTGEWDAVNVVVTNTKDGLLTLKVEGEGPVAIASTTKKTTAAGNTAATTTKTSASGNTGAAAASTGVTKAPKTGEV